MPQGGEFDIVTILKVEEIIEKDYLSGTKELGTNSNCPRSATSS